MRAVPAFACLLFLINPAAGSAARIAEIQEAAAPPSKPAETYRLRVMNTLYGAVDASTDGGATWQIVARVLKPAVERVPGAQRDEAVVEKVGPQGMAFGVGDHKLVRLLPDTPANHRDPAAIVVNQTPVGSLFKDLLPPVGSSVMQVVNRRPVAMLSVYLPAYNDLLLFIVTRTDPEAPKLEGYIKEASLRYHDAAIAKLRAAGKKPMSGFLTLTANPSEGDNPGAITFLVDGAVAGILNRAPFSLRLDTRNWENGEHLIEVRGLNENGASYTQKKVLVVVDNRPNP
jgi:hypothetical protein